MAFDHNTEQQVAGPYWATNRNGRWQVCGRFGRVMFTYDNEAMATEHVRRLQNPRRSAAAVRSARLQRASMADEMLETLKAICRPYHRDGSFSGDRYADAVQIAQAMIEKVEGK
jgi:hypothetical protein